MLPDALGELWSPSSHLASRTFHSSLQKAITEIGDRWQYVIAILKTIASRKHALIMFSCIWPHLARHGVLNVKIGTLAGLGIIHRLLF